MARSASFAHTLPVSFYEDLVKMGSGLMEGRFYAAGLEGHAS